MTRRYFLRFATVTVLFPCSLLLAQNSAPPSGGNSSASAAGRNRPEPCWQQVGISRTVMKEHHSIEMDAHSQIASVCENSSLTEQQKQKQVREIRQQAQQKVDASITSEQQSGLHSCQQQRIGNGSPNGGHRPRGTGPCGNFAAQRRQGSSNGKSPESSPQASQDGPQN